MDTRPFCVICDKWATDKCRDKGHTVREAKNFMFPELSDVDMLEDIFVRNADLTKFLRSNAPRSDMPEKLLEALRTAPTVHDKDYGIPDDTITDAIKEIQMMRNTLALFAEVAEYNDETPFKWWGRGAWNTQKDKAAEELIDMLHFLMIAFEDLGLTPKDIHRMYCEKNKRNWQRFEEKLGWGKPQR